MGLGKEEREKRKKRDEQRRENPETKPRGNPKSTLILEPADRAPQELPGSILQIRQATPTN